MGWADPSSERPPTSHDPPPADQPASWLEAERPQLPGSSQAWDKGRAGAPVFSSGNGVGGWDSEQRVPCTQVQH